jgi:AcrR family transcriptional regulator
MPSPKTRTQPANSAALQRGTPQRARAAHRVQDLLTAARQVFSEHGYQGATMAMIAQATGVSEATVFTYFAGKRELCIQVITDWYADISSALERDVPQLSSVHAKVSHVVRAHLVTLLADGSGLCALVLSEGRAAEPELAAVITDCKRRYTAPLMHTLAEGQAQGLVRQDMPLRLLRDLVYGSMEHVLWDAITTLKRPRIDSTAEQLTELIWSAIAPRDASLSALMRLRDEVTQALRHATAAEAAPATAPATAQATTQHPTRHR